MSGIYGYTSSYKFKLINFNTTTWHDYEYDNWRMLDTLLASYIGISSIKGAWTNSTAYAANDVVIDSVAGGIFKCVTARVSAASPTTFVQDRAASGGWTAIGAANLNAQARRSADNAKLNAGIASQRAIEAFNSAIGASTSETNAGTSAANALLSELAAASYSSAAANSEYNAQYYANQASNLSRISYEYTNRTQKNVIKAEDAAMLSETNVQRIMSLSSNVKKYATRTEDFYNNITFICNTVSSFAAQVSGYLRKMLKIQKDVTVMKGLTDYNMLQTNNLAGMSLANAQRANKASKRATSSTTDAQFVLMSRVFGNGG